jgi:hypothetical protein
MRLEATHVNPVAVPILLRAQIQIIIPKTSGKSSTKNLFSTCLKSNSGTKLTRPTFRSKRSSELSSGVKPFAKCHHPWFGNAIATSTLCACSTILYPTTSYSERSSALAASLSKPALRRTAATYRHSAKLKFRAHSPKSSRM